MSNKKKVLIGVIIFIVVLVILLAVLNPNLIKRLTGEISGINDKETEAIDGNFVNDICNISVDNENFMTVSGTIIIDKGKEGTATINVKSDNLVFTKEITVKSNDYSSFTYTLPRGNYSLTVTKDGYKTYETEVSESKELNITLVSSELGDIIASSRTIYNTYYDYYSDGTIHLKTIGSLGEYLMSEDEEKIMDKNFNYSVLTDVLIKILNRNGYKTDLLDEASDDASKLLSSIILSTFLGDGSFKYYNDDITIRKVLIEANSKIENGQCTAQNYLSDENCNGVKDFVEPFLGKNYSFEDLKNLIQLIISIPAQTKLIIDSDVAALPLLTYTTADEVTIGKYVIIALGYVFFGANIKTLNINSPYFGAEFGSFFAMSTKINNLIIGNGITKIPNDSFAESIIDNFTLPETLKEIESEAFTDTKMNGVVIPDHVEKIGTNAFNGCGLSEVKLSKRLTTIGNAAFYDNNLTSIIIPSRVTSIGYNAFLENPLTSVIIEGNKTRFNSRWTSIGFPENLKPSN